MYQGTHYKKTFQEEEQSAKLTLEFCAIKLNLGTKNDSYNNDDDYNDNETGISIEGIGPKM